MNKRAAVIISILVLIATFVFAFAVSAVRENMALTQTNRLFESQSSVYLTQVAETLRNDLLQENFRVVRNRLSALREDALFSDYSVTRGNEVVDESDLFSARKSNAEFFLTFVPVEFSKRGRQHLGFYPVSDISGRPSKNVRIAQGLTLCFVIGDRDLCGSNCRFSALGLLALCG